MNHDGAGNYRFYAEGSLVGIVSKTPTDNSAAIHIGAAIDGGAPLKGNLDEILWEKHDDLVVTTDSTYVVETVAFPDL